MSRSQIENIYSNMGNKDAIDSKLKLFNCVDVRYVLLGVRLTNVQNLRHISRSRQKLSYCTCIDFQLMFRQF